MEYVQMTLSDWMDIKEKIRKDLNNVKHAFVRVGYNLRRIRDEELYLQDGYTTISEFAKEEYSLEASTVSRLISINEKYSVDGYSEQLLPEYEDFKQGALTEMLALPQEDLQMVTPETSREDIRELKRFNKAAPAEITGYLEVVEAFCRENRELINELYTYSALDSTAERDLIEMINPSGSRVFRKGMYFLSFTDTEIKVKYFGGQPQSHSYQNFMKNIMEVMGSGRKDNAWEEHFGWPEEKQVEALEQTMPKPETAKAETKTEGNDRKPEKTDAKPQKTDAETEKSAAETQQTDTARCENAAKAEGTETEEKQSVEETKAGTEDLKKTGPGTEERAEDLPAKDVPSGEVKEDVPETEETAVNQPAPEAVESAENQAKQPLAPAQFPDAKTHNIRLNSRWFDDVAEGRKTFELRKNDREYQVGDILELMEFDDGRYSGRMTRCRVTYMLEKVDGLAEGYCILGTVRM